MKMTRAGRSGRAHRGLVRSAGVSVAVVAVAAGLAGVAAPAGASGIAGNEGRPAGQPAQAQFSVPAVGLVKSASVQEYSAAGTAITYTYAVTNTGDVPLAKVTVTDPMAGLSAINCSGSGSNIIPSLAVGASETCTATYTTTAGDVKAGSISNTGTATGITATGSTVKYSSSLTIPEPGRPYTCKYPPEYFLSESHATSGPTTLFHSTASPAIYVASPAPPYAGAYNAIGFDPTGANEGYIYGMTRHAANNELIKIDDTGAILAGYPKVVTGYPTAAPSPVVGAFDPSGNYWVTDGGGLSALAYEINVGTPAVDAGSPVTISPDSFMPDDWSWTAGAGYPNGATGHPGFLWGLYGNQLYRVSTTGADGHWTVPGIPTTPKVYGAAWTFGNGDLGFSNNATGLIYEVSVGTPAAAAAATPHPVLAGAPYAGPQSSNALNDGTSCLGQDTDLGIISTGPATVEPGGTITWNLTVSNDGPGESSGFLVNDATKGAISDVTTSTPGCAVAGKGLEVQCAEGTLGNGDSFTVTLSGTAPQAVNDCVVDTAAVIANEADPDAKNNTSSVKTCTTGDTGLPAMGQPRRRI